MKMEKLKRDSSMVARVSHRETPSEYLSQCSESALWELFLQGHEGAFTFIYQVHFDPLYRYGKQLGFQTEKVEDALQDLFVTLRTKRNKLSQVSNIKAYLFKSLRRELMKQKPPILLFGLLEEEEKSASFQVAVNQELRFIKEQMSEIQCQQLKMAINGLPRRQREAIYHFFYEGFNYAELAEIMGLNSAKIARNLVYKSLESLRANKSALPEWLLASLLMVAATL